MDNIKNIQSYHQQTKHRLDKYANGPETIDWEGQPSAFRYFPETDFTKLPLTAKTLSVSYSSLWQKEPVPKKDLSLDSLGGFFELCLALSAWKVYGTAKWSVRCNPSSGNLHPTEAYALLPKIEGLPSGIYHYCPEQHAVEKRGVFGSDSCLENFDTFYIGLNSIPWREAWKYGERAFRYCQLDTGHALMAIRMAAAILGWNAQISASLDNQQLTKLLGLDRSPDFYDDEKEHAEVLIKISTDTSTAIDDLSKLKAEFFGKANRLDKRHFYNWPIIEDAFQASADATYVDEAIQETLPERKLNVFNDNAIDIIKTRRSATDFNPSTVMPLESFYQIVDSLLARNDKNPWDVYPTSSNISLVFYVHRVEGLKQGLYTLMRNDEHLNIFKENMRQEFSWEKEPTAPQHLPFYTLLNANAQKAAGTLSCHQHIASNSAFCVSMISTYSQVMSQGSGMYRQLHWEAGMIGQLLYLEAEAVNFRGTGIGCFFDDAVHETLGIKDDTLQVVYHFTVGDPVIDQRITSLQAYTNE